MKTLLQKIAHVMLLLTIVSGLFSPLAYATNTAYALGGEAVVEVGPALVAQKATWWNSAVTALKSVGIAISTAWNASLTYALKFKEYVLMPLVRSIAKALLQRMAKDTVKWINNGFEGKPAFLTNPGEYFTGVANDEIGRYLIGQGLDWLCSPFSLQIKLALKRRMEGGYTPPKCTLTDMIKNIDGFIKNNGGIGWDKVVTYTETTGDVNSFSVIAESNNAGFNTVVNRATGMVQGNTKWSGWGNFMGVFGEPSQNPIASFLIAENDLYLQVGNKVETPRQDLNLGGGLMSWKSCTGYDGKPTCMDDLQSAQPTINTANPLNLSYLPGATAATTSFVTTPTPTNGPLKSRLNQDNTVKRVMTKDEVSAYKASYQSDGPCLKWQEPKCVSEKTETPGSWINDWGTEAFGSEWRQLELAKEFDDIIQALIGQLIKGIFTGGASLLGIGQNGADGKNQADRVTEQDLINADARQRQILQDNAIADMQAANDINSDGIAQDKLIQKTISGNGQPLTWDQINGNGRFSAISDQSITNVALDKRTSQSTTKGGSSNNAVDNVTSNSPDSGYSSTDTGSSEWWMVDLGAYYSISKVVIYPRGDINPNLSLGQYQISILDNDNNSTLVINSSTSNSTYVPIEVPTLFTASSSGLLSGPRGTPTIGRYVKIARTDNGQLQLAEVQVMGVKNQVVFDESSSNVNIYLNSGELISDYSGTLFFDTNGAMGNLKIFSSMILSDRTGEHLLPLQTLFSLLKMGIAKVNKTTKEVSEVTPEINPNLINQIVQIANNLNLDPNYYYAVVYNGSLKTIGQLRNTLVPGQYILRTEIRDIENNNVDTNNIYFTVS